MPELPEMENYRRQLAQNIVGQHIQAIRAERPKRLNLPSDEATAMLHGRRIHRVERRGKSVAVIIDDARPEAHALYVHLMLGGRIATTATFEPAAVTLSLDEGFTIQYHVGLGRVELLSATELHTRWAKLGVEPLSPAYHPEIWEHAYQHSQRSIKACLMDQHVVAGIGNVYSDEILYRAGLYPGTPAHHLTPRDWEAIGVVVPQLLQHAVQLGGVGTPLNAHDQETGHYRPLLKVHYQEGQPCGTGGTVRKERIAGRTAYWCPAVQSPRS